MHDADCDTDDLTPAQIAECERFDPAHLSGPDLRRHVEGLIDALGPMLLPLDAALLTEMAQRGAQRENLLEAVRERAARQEALEKALRRCVEMISMFGVAVERLAHVPPDRDVDLLATAREVRELIEAAVAGRKLLEG
jgi:hypothetical protein